MDDGLILETTFLVDLEREAWAETPGRAHEFLEASGDSVLCVTLTTAAELAAGSRVAGRERWQELVGRFNLLIPDLECSWQYGQVFRYLKENGMLIGANDLWIAATAVAHGLPLVTRNEEHFRRVPGLQLIGY